VPTARRAERAAALLIVLAFLVLLTGITVAYLTRTTQERPAVHGSFNQAKADELAASAADVVIGDFRQEIVSNSTATTVGSTTIYALPPSSNASMLPTRSTSSAGNPEIPNLIRQSWKDDTNLNPRSRASAVNTSESSPDGRSISAARWNEHYLVPRPAGANPTSTDPVGTFPSPDWVILCRGGPTAFGTWNSALADSSPNNDSYAIGRYAYAVYDEGGLLDVNASGYPSSGVTAAQYGLKGPSAFADLSQLGLTSGAINALVGFRNYASAQPSGNFPSFNFNTTSGTNFVNFVLSRSTGFLTVGTNTVGSGQNIRTDQTFVTRQTLIRMAASSGFTSITNNLQYLGTFSRELNAPSWTPAKDASAMGGNNGAGNIYAYSSNANSSAATNRNVLSVRATNSFTRADGTVAAAGEPLINRRFPLTRVNGLSDPTFASTTNSTIVGGVLAPATAGTVQRDFGLVWDASSDPVTGQPRNRWNYVGASTTNTAQPRILTLEEVAQGRVLDATGAYTNGALYREPNFFELLKAAILSGSVGLGSGSANTFVAAETKYYDNSAGLSSDYQIIQIGANIIDQWDPNNVPTFIGFGVDPATLQAYEIAGVENLPYLNKLVFKPYWRSGTQFDAWLGPSLWNPHQNASSAPATTIRIALPTGTLTGYATGAGGTPFITSFPITGTSALFMTVSSSQFGTTPSAPTTVSGTPPSGITQMDNSLGKYYGFHFAFPSGSTVTSSNVSTAYPDFGTGCNFELQVQIGTSWKAYQRWNRCGPGHPLSCQTPPSWTVTTLQDPEFVALDPRTLRFGVWGNDGHDTAASSDFTAGILTTLDQSVGSPPSTGVFETIPPVTALRPQGTNFTSSTSPNLYLYANNVDATVRYLDLDGVQRRGDVISAGGWTSEMQPADSADRPRVLNRAFQSVAELSEVFRDQPWKTLNLITGDSADAGLLDFFTLHEASIEAGKTSLGTKQLPVLKALLSQSSRSLTGANLLSATQIDDGSGHGLAPDLMSMTANNPFQNKTELITRITNINSDPAYAYSQDVATLGNKEARECLLRALSDSGQTRTWNLLIDVIAQSGRYPPTANGLSQFLVQGEQRYWVHVAIDRFTGQVIDKQIEVVNE
jgi:Tfp pilus assembly protein PilX